jgi:outer membrane protein TolC
VSHSLPRIPFAAALLLAGCTSPQEYARESDAIVDDILSGSAERLDQERRATIVQPAERVEPPPPPAAGEPDAVRPPASEAAAPAEGAPPLEMRLLTLKDALAIAVVSNREYIGQLESLYEQALALHGVRHSFGPLLTAGLNYAFAASEGADATSSGGFSVGLSQVLPWGGDVSASASATHATVEGDPGSFGTSAALSLRQPLLRGFGREPGLEPLVAAERGLMYRIRDFELFRENFSSQVARQFYNLVQQKRALDNQRRNLEDAVFARRQAEATFALGDVSELEVLRARRSELNSQNELIQAEEDLRRALDGFRIFLGLPPGVAVDVADQAPTFVEVTYDVESAIEVALANRLDVRTRKDQLDDAARSLRLAENGVLPNLDLSLSYGVATVPDASFLHQDLGDGGFSATVNLGLPIDQTQERQSLRRAQISYRQSLRGYDEFEQNLVVDIRSTFRELERRVQSLEIQRQSIVDQERSLKIAQLLFEQGVNSNRDVVEAQQALLEARNALIREQVDYEIARLGLIRDLGILFIDEHGMWTQ